MKTLSVVGLLLVSTLSGQVQFKVETEVVLLDVIVRARDGSPVEGLRKEEIKVIENGTERPVTFLEPFDFRPGPAPEHRLDDSFDSTPSGDQVTWDRPPRPVPFIFVVDLNSIDPVSFHYVRESIGNFLTSDDLGKFDRYMVVTVGNGLKVRSALTSDVEVIVESVDRISLEREPVSFVAWLREVDNIYRVDCRNRAECDPLGSALMASRSFLMSLEDRIKSTNEDLASLGSYLGVIPHRKNLIFYSNGYPLRIGPAVYDIIKSYEAKAIVPRDDPDIIAAKLAGFMSARSEGGLRSSIQSLNRSQASMYCVDARRLVAKTLATSNDGFDTGGVQTWKNTLISRYNTTEITAAQQYHSTLSRRTGGRSLLNWNELERGIQMAVADSRSHYLVGYVPARKKAKKRKKKESEIRVEVSRPNVRVLTRSDWFQRAANSSELSAAFRFPGLYQDFTVEHRAESDPGSGLLKVSVSMPTQSLAFGRKNEKQICTIRLRGALLDADGNWVDSGFLFHRKFPLELDEVQVMNLRQSPEVTITAEARVPEGKHDLVVVVSLEPSGRLSSFSTPLEISGSESSAARPPGMRFH